MSDLNILGALTLTCYKCTRQQMFEAESRGEAVKQARSEGWIMDDVAESGQPPDLRQVCPKCPAYRGPVN